MLVLEKKKKILNEHYTLIINRRTNGTRRKIYMQLYILYIIVSCNHKSRRIRDCIVVHIINGSYYIYTYIIYLIYKQLFKVCHRHFVALKFLKTNIIVTCHIL